MATIVQPYNPWKEQLALTALGNVAGNILSDLWQSHRQNEQNRKANAFRGQLQQNLQNNAQPDISLTPKEAPQGYNSNPWANALHQNYTPLTAFDIGTSTVGKAPSIQDIVQGADSLAASKRFSMLSPELVQGVKNSMIQQAETQRLKDLQNNFADMFGNAKTPAEQMRALILANLYGFGDKAIAPFSQWAAHSTPHHQYQEINAGDKILAVDFNPADGSMRQGTAVNVGINPTNKYVTDSSARASNYSADRSANSHMYSSNLVAETAKQDLAFREYQQTMTDYDNRLKGINDSITAHLDYMNNYLQNDKERATYRLQFIAPLEQDKARITAERDAMQENYRSSLGFGSSQATQGNAQRISKSNYDDLISNASKTHGVDQDLIYAVMQIESGHKNGLTSNKGAQGLMQLMPDTAKRFGVTDVWNPEQNINGGVAYLKWLLNRYGGNEEKALQAYHCGEGRVAREGTKDNNNVPAVSVQYAKNVLAIANKRRAARQTTSQNQNSTQINATQSSPPQPQTEATATQTQQQTTTQSQQNTTSKSPVTAYVNEFDPYAYISTDDGNSYSKAEIERLAKSQGLTLDEWLKKNNVQPFPDWKSVGTPRDPIAYMSDSYGNYLTLDEVQREAARKNISLDDYEKQLREQGFRKSGEEVNNEPTQVPLTALTEAQPVPALPDSYSDKNRRNSPPNTAGNPHAGVSQGNFSDFFSVPWGSFDIHQPILGGQRQQPLPQQQTVSNDSRLSPLFSDNAINAASDFLHGLNLTSGDETKIIPERINPDIIDYSFDPRYSDRQRSAWQNANGYDLQQIFDWINRYANNENPFRPPLSALSSSQNPSNKSLRYYSGNMAGGLLPENAYDREKIDGEYQFLDPQLTALNGSLPYWYGGPLSDDAYQLNFLLKSLGVTADKYPYIKRY